MTRDFQNVKVIVKLMIALAEEVNGLTKENAKLRGRIVEKYGSQVRFAEKIGKTVQTVTAKLNGNSGFSQDDIVEWATALDIESNSVGDYFFAHLLSKS